MFLILFFFFPLFLSNLVTTSIRSIKVTPGKCGSLAGPLQGKLLGCGTSVSSQPAPSPIPPHFNSSQGIRGKLFLTGRRQPSKECPPTHMPQEPWAHRHCRVNWNSVFWKLGCQVSAFRSRGRGGVLLCFVVFLCFEENGVPLAPRVLLKYLVNANQVY